MLMIRIGIGIGISIRIRIRIVNSVLAVAEMNRWELSVEFVSTYLLTFWEFEAVQRQRERERVTDSSEFVVFGELLQQKQQSDFQIVKLNSLI
ncbi:hypothetical protein Ddye_005637 [Dipteronia dyeriana]|uniref:Uncharacterized protein n=1 Tax=Dipteronia dyeriana TaxID=168575 RepID=A0AAD9XGP4_9ROSI|nr:hypothetical protein Ddye_005637 [Dipteronia dyeriana]